MLPLVEILSYGVSGIALAMIFYSGVLLKQELDRPAPRPSARNLILIFMAFCIIVGGGVFAAESAKRRTENEAAASVQAQEHKATLSNIATLVSEIDANLGGKYQVAIDQIPDQNTKRQLIYFENELCRSVRDLKAVLMVNGDTRCRIEGE
jgi:hypothetical protein